MLFTVPKQACLIIVSVLFFFFGIESNCKSDPCTFRQSSAFSHFASLFFLPPLVFVTLSLVVFLTQQVAFLFLFYCLCATKADCFFFFLTGTCRAVFPLQIFQTFRHSLSLFFFLNIRSCVFFSSPFYFYFPSPAHV